jgi:hypothetical protein
MKQILINDCYKCPYRRSYTNECKLNEKEQIDDINDIPEWCPLDDYKVEKNLKE